MQKFRSTFSILVTWFTTISLAWAVSIYDVIELSRQGYSDEEIVNIIQTTRSVFKLTAEDIPRLKKLGVKEVVIRTMLESVPVELSETESIPSDSLVREPVPLANSSIADHRSNDHVEETAPATAGRHPHANSGDHQRTTLPTITSNRFSIQFVSEEAAGDHQHVYVTLEDLPILILRDEGRFQSVEDRGRTLAANLEEAVLMGEGRFKVLHTDNADLVVYRRVDMRREVPIITVSRRDVQAYDVRSERHVTADMLASYWAALLNDYWAITIQRRPPNRLVKLHRGDALMLLFDVVNRKGLNEPLNLGLAVQQLPGTIQRHLERLAVAVPDDFDSWLEYVGETS